MSTLDHVIAYYYPGQDARSLVDERRTQIKNLVRYHTRRPTTRLLVVALPPNMPIKAPGAMALPAADRTARDRRQVVSEFYSAERKEAHPNELRLPALPATAILCNVPEQILAPFLRRTDEALLASTIPIKLSKTTCGRSSKVRKSQNS